MAIAACDGSPEQGLKTAAGRRGQSIIQGDAAKACRRSLNASQRLENAVAHRPRPG